MVSLKKQLKTSLEPNSVQQPTPGEICKYLPLCMTGCRENSEVPSELMPIQIAPVNCSSLRISSVITKVFVEPDGFALISLLKSQSKAILMDGVPPYATNSIATVFPSHLLPLKSKRYLFCWPAEQSNVVQPIVRDLMASKSNTEDIFTSMSAKRIKQIFIHLFLGEKSVFQKQSPAPPQNKLCPFTSQLYPLGISVFSSPMLAYNQSPPFTSEKSFISAQTARVEKSLERGTSNSNSYSADESIGDLSTKLFSGSSLRRGWRAAVRVKWQETGHLAVMQREDPDFSLEQSTLQMPANSFLAVSHLSISWFLSLIEREGCWRGSSGGDWTVMNRSS